MMVKHLPEQSLDEMSRFIEERMALHFPKNRWRDLERGLRAAAKQLGFEDIQEFARWILTSATRGEIDILASHLTVGETYFFRDRVLFRNLEEKILPELIALRRQERRLRIWSAGCCTGEEAYSVAILLRQLIPAIDTWNISILATDINPCFLKAATVGTYKEWSFRDTPAWVKSRYFEKVDRNQYRINESFRAMVTFSYLNLAEDVYPSLLNNTNGMDIILCRNVLMYFSAEQVRRVVCNLCAALVQDGWLAVSPAETSLISLPRLARVNLSGATLYRKSNSPIQTAPDFSTSPSPPPDPATLSPVSKREAPVPPSKTSHAKTPNVSDENRPVTSPWLEARRMYEAGSYAKAADQLRSILRQQPMQPAAAGLLARVLANRGNLVEALDWCDTALNLEKLNPEFHYLRATILQEQGHAQGCVEALRRALFLEPNFVLAHFALGNIALHQRKAAEAGRHFDNALVILAGLPDETVIPGSDGMTSGRLREVINATMQQEQTA